jgi:tetratricopeptide (TPR) repeat protein
LDVKVEKLAQPAMKGFIALLLFLNLCLFRGRVLLGAQEGQPAPLPATAGQTHEIPAKPRPLSFEERADIYMARKSYEDAVDYYYRALKEAHFANPIAWNKLGIAYQQLQNYHASRKAYNQALRHQKNYAEALNNIGTTYFMQDKYGKSVKYYLRALKLNTNSAAYHVNLGTSYFHMKKYTESVEEYRAALKLDPEVFTKRSAFGTTVQTRGADPEYYFYLGKVFASLGRADDAVRSLRRALEDGFKDRKRILNDPDFMKISQNPAYVELMNNPPVGIKD